MRIYNLFRRKGHADLYCAVPEDVVVPAFVTEGSWEYARSIDIATLSGFDAGAAQVSVQANGFYLFHMTRLEQCLRAWMSCTFVFVELLPAIRIRRAECSATR
jgi:hypothetical protein